MLRLRGVNCGAPTRENCRGDSLERANCNNPPDAGFVVDPPESGVDISVSRDGAARVRSGSEIAAGVAR